MPEESRCDSKNGNEWPVDSITTEGWYDQVSYLISKTFHDSDEIKILYFGGGDGIAYNEINARLAPLEYNLNWNIVELPHTIEKYKNPEKKCPLWHTEISNVDEKINVIYSDAAIQCILDWKKTLSELCSKNSEWIFIRRLPSGDFETVKAKTQDPITKESVDKREGIYGLSDNSETLEFWFLNEREFVGHMNSLGYSVYAKYLYGFHREYSLIQKQKESSSLNGRKNCDGRTRLSFIFKKRNN